MVDGISYEEWTHIDVTFMDENYKVISLDEGG